MSGSSLQSGSSLTTALSNLAASPTFYIQSDWENVLREFNTARTQGAGAVDRLGKESKQFWFSLQKMGTDGIESTASLSASTNSADAHTSATSLTAAAKSVHAESSTPDFEVKFMNPLQLLAYNADASFTQLIQAPRSTFNSLHPASQDIFSLDISAAGNLAISGAAGGTLRTWDPNTGNPLKDLKGHEGDVTFVRMFPSGSVALSAGLDLGMKVWALDSGLVAAKLNGHTRPVTNVHFIDRGRHLVSSSEDGTAKLWDVSVQQAITSYPAHPDAFPPKVNDCLLMDPTQRASIPEASTASSTSTNFPSNLASNLLITGGADGILRGFDLRSTVQAFMIPLPASAHAGGIERLAHGPKEASVTLGTSEGVIAVLDLRSKGALYAMRQDDAAITNLRPWTENSFWSTSSTGQVSLWKLDDASDTATTSGCGRIVAQLSGVDCEPVHDICFTSNHNMAFASSHGAVRAYMLSSFLSASSSEEVKAFHDFSLPTPKLK